MRNELYLTMIYRPDVVGKKFVEKSANVPRLQAEQDQPVAKQQELAGNVEAVLKDYAPVRLGMYEGDNGVVFSETLECFGYLLNRREGPGTVLRARVCGCRAVSRHLCAARPGDLVVAAPSGDHHFGAILNVKECTGGT